MGKRKLVARAWAVKKGRRWMDDEGDWLPRSPSYWLRKRDAEDALAYVHGRGHRDVIHVVPIEIWVVGRG